MAVDHYRVNLLSFEDCPLQKYPYQVIDILKAWRKSNTYATKCSVCNEKLEFVEKAWTTCCEQFYFDGSLRSYPVQSIAVPTPGYKFVLPILERQMEKSEKVSDQDFLILPDPIYWQLSSTLTYEKVMKFVQGLPVTQRTEEIQPPERGKKFFTEMLDAPLNYGSMARRSGGKYTILRYHGFGKRCILSMRGMIVPDAELSPKEIRLPVHIVETFNLHKKWVILNRMPSLQPGNFIGLRVSSLGWEWDCFGLPLEVVESMGADFDGDETNLYVLPNAMSQAEVATLLNPENQLGCFVMQGPKLTPSQDMLVAYHLKYDEIDFLPYKNRDLNTTFKVLYDIHGSKQTFEYFDRLRKYYLDVLQNETVFGLTLEEMEQLYTFGRGTFEEFKEKAEKTDGCLVTQVKSGAKGSYEHLYQMFGKIGYQDGKFIESSFWDGLNEAEAVDHTKTSTDALSKAGKIWEPGYSYYKMVFNLRGVTVDYQGRLMDGETVLEMDALHAFHHTDLISEEGFTYLLEMTLGPTNF